MIVSCEILEQTPNSDSLVPVVLKTTYTQLGCDSLLQCQRLDVKDTSLYPVMNDVISLDSMQQHVQKGEKSWYEICFNYIQDTMIVDLIANQYYRYSDLYLNDIYGVFYYKDKIFAVKKTNSFPNSFFSATNDSISVQRIYQGSTVYFFKKDRGSVPNNALISYKYNGNTFVKQYTFLNGRIYRD